MAGDPFYRGALLRLASLIGLTVALLAVVPSTATAICCVCEGSVASNCASGPPSCAECAAVCETLGGAAMRACCETTNCSGGVADSCPPAGTLCQQTEIGSGFCDGSCTSAAQAPTLAPWALLVTAALLSGFGAFDLRRRMRNRRR